MISVIVPVYNAERYVDRCVASILGQTLRDLEVLLIDDGSADDSGLICYAHALRDRRVVYVRAANAGEGAARNRGLALARGDLVAFADNDDWLEPGMYAAMAAAMADGIDVVMCNATIHTRDGQALMGPDDAPALYAAEEFRRMTLFRESRISPGAMHVNWNKLYRRSAVGGTRFVEGACIGGDFAFNLEVLGACRRVAYLPRPLYHYRHTGNGFSMSRFTAGHLTAMAVFDHLRPLFAARPDWLDRLDFEQAQVIYSYMLANAHDPGSPELYAREPATFAALRRLADACEGFAGHLDGDQRRVFALLRDTIYREGAPSP